MSRKEWNILIFGSPFDMFMLINNFHTSSLYINIDLVFRWESTNDFQFKLHFHFKSKKKQCEIIYRTLVRKLHTLPIQHEFTLQWIMPQNNIENDQIMKPLQNVRKITSYSWRLYSSSDGQQNAISLRMWQPPPKIRIDSIICIFETESKKAHYDDLYGENEPNKRIFPFFILFLFHTCNY